MEGSCGIDVSKAYLDIMLNYPKIINRIPNSPAGCKELLKICKKYKPKFVIIEATGGYEQEALCTLSKGGIPVSLINPYRVREFARAKGILAKTDKLDAEVLCEFGATMKPPATVLADEDQRALNNLVDRRIALKTLIIAEKNRKEKNANQSVKESIFRTVQFLEKECLSIDEQIESLIEANELLKHKVEILTSAKGIGNTIAAALIALLPELGTLNSKQIASLAGVCPFNRDSGSKKGTMTTYGGRKKVRSALYMATLVAIRHNPTLKDFYQNVLKNRKVKMVALVATMRKFLIILNAMVKNGNKWGVYSNDSSIQ